MALVRSGLAGIMGVTNIRSPHSSGERSDVETDVKVADTSRPTARV